MAGRKLADSKVQTVSFKRSATKDLVTGKVTYGAWDPKSGTFEAVESPTIAGYTAVPTKVDAMTVDPDKTQDTTVQVLYTANKATIVVNFIDTQDNNNVVQSKTFTGKTDQNVTYDFSDITPKLSNYNITDLPKSGTYTANPQTITVKLTHKVITATADNAQGVSGLTKTVTRTINYNAEA